ncbi:hypothetical protein VTK26DRAFT_9074 [Humicola hyalothermophila]
MANQGSQIPPQPDYSGLQHVAQSDLEPLPDHSTLEPLPPNFYQQRAKEAYAAAAYAPYGQPLYQEPQREKILGLSVKAFWTVIVLLVLVVAGAIGGGVGGGLAARGRAESSSATAGDEAPSQTQGSGVSTGDEKPTTTETTTESTPATTTSTSASASPTVPQRCPSMNGTTSVALDSTGAEIRLPTASEGQSFVTLCNTNYPADGTNPHIRDILRVFRPTIGECIAACAEYNAGNFDAATPLSDQELCRNVAIDSTQSNYCFLKNDTGVNKTVAASRLYISATLVDFGLGDNTFL